MSWNLDQKIRFGDSRADQMCLRQKIHERRPVLWFLPWFFEVISENFRWNFHEAINVTGNWDFHLKLFQMLYLVHRYGQPIA